MLLQVLEQLVLADGAFLLAPLNDPAIFEEDERWQAIHLQCASCAAHIVPAWLVGGSHNTGGSCMQGDPGI